MLRLFAACSVLLLTASAAWPQEGCGVAKDLVVRALENLKAGAAATDIEDGIQLLKQGAQACPALGDAWYYRSLFEEKAGHKPQAAFSLRQAKIIGSEAMTNGLNPFSLAASPQAEAPLGPVAKKWALVIGIGKFKSKNIPRLNYPKKDAEDFAAFLEDPKLGRFDPANVKVLTDANANLVDIKAQLNWIAGHAGPSDLVLVFVASHGTARDKDPVGSLNYILVSDTDNSDGDRLYGSALPMIDVSEIIRSRVQARRTVVLLDTCHSEGSTKGLLRPANASGVMLDGMKAGMGRAIIASSQLNQLSYESNQLENGIFTHFLIEALAQQNGKASLSSVFGYLQDHVSKQALAEQKAAQVPVMVRSEGGSSEIVIGVEPSQATAATSAMLLLPSPGQPAPALRLPGLSR